MGRVCRIAEEGDEAGGTLYTFIGDHTEMCIIFF